MKQLQDKPAPPRPGGKPPTWIVVVENILKVMVAILVVILAIVLHDVFNDRDPMDRLPSWESERWFTPVALRTTLPFLPDAVGGADAVQWRR